MCWEGLLTLVDEYKEYGNVGQKHIYTPKALSSAAAAVDKIAEIL